MYPYFFQPKIKNAFPESRRLRNGVDDLYTERTINDDGDVVYSVDMSKVPIGNVVIYSHSGVNDEPPYVGTTFYDVCPTSWYPVNPSFTKRGCHEDSESFSFFLVPSTEHRATFWCRERNLWEKLRLEDLHQDQIESGYDS